MNAYIKLAQQALEHYVTTGLQIRKPDGLPDELTKRRAGVFVTLYSGGQLRGCIGTVESTTPSIADEIIANAISAGVYDPRFPRVMANDLKHLIYSVDVLGEAFPVVDRGMLDAKRYGVIVTKGRRRGLLLPNLDGVETPDRQIQIALEKARISPEEPYTLEAFEVVRYGQES